MPKKRLDDSTLEVIAETICGEGQGAGGGPAYGSPSPYRTKSEIYAFFRRASVEPKGQSSTRKWFVLESLQVGNQDITGELLPVSLERVLLRLASPQEYRGDVQVTQAVIGHLNSMLAIEGIKLIVEGVNPGIIEVAPSMDAPKSKKPGSVPPPDFNSLVSEPNLAEILLQRWHEANRCVDAEAHLSAVIMMGSVLEGVLLFRAESNSSAAYKCKDAPRDKAGNPRPLAEWGLSRLIDVAHDLGWLGGDVKRFSHSLRESRNIVHPYVHRLMGETPDGDTCSICWQVVRAAVADLLEVDKDKEPKSR